MTRRRGGCQESPVTIQTVANLVLLWGWSSAEKGGSTQRGGPQHPCQAGLDWACTRTQDGFEPAARSQRVWQPAQARLGPAQLESGMDFSAGTCGQSQ